MSYIKRNNKRLFNIIVLYIFNYCITVINPLFFDFTQRKQKNNPQKKTFNIDIETNA
jgi:hypothetical protein